MDEVHALETGADSAFGGLARLAVAFGAGTFALLTSVAHVSTKAVLERERASRPLAWWERALPASLAVLTFAVLLLLAGLAVLFGWSVAAIVERLQGS